MRRLSFAFAAALLAMPVGLAGSPSSAQEAEQQAADLVEQDQIFASEASANSRMEIELSKLATERAEDREVKQFAEHMVQEHDQMSQELSSILADLKVPQPDSMPAQAKSDLDRLSGLSGPSFDREYMKLMVRSHDKAAAAFGDQSEAGRNAALKKFASTHLGAIRAHLDRALTLDGKMSVATQTAPTDPLQSQGEANADAANIEPNKPIEQRTVADVVEQPVFTRDDELVGKIKEVMLDQTSRTCLAILPVGGVLGIGEKDVAVECSKLRHKADNEPKGALVVDATEDELKDSPAFEMSEKRYLHYPDDRKLGELGKF